MSATENVLAFRRESAPLTDLELVERYRSSGDLAHVGQLFERYSHLALGVSLRYLRNKEDAEDAVMEIFEHLTVALKKHRMENFKNWFYSVVANHCRMTLRKRKTLPTGVDRSEELLDAVLASAPALTGGDAEDEAELQQLSAALSGLNEAQRRCVELFYLKGKSYNEVAELSGFSLNEVKSYLQNGKRNLKLLMTERRPS